MGTNTGKALLALQAKSSGLVGLIKPTGYMLPTSILKSLRKQMALKSKVKVFQEIYFLKYKPHV